MNLNTVEKVKESKPFTALDAAIVLAIIAVIAVLMIGIYGRPASVVSISVGGVTKEYSLDDDAEIELGVMTVHIENGCVWVTDADCRDRTCEYAGKISRGGQTVICLPNRVVISIGGKSDLDWELGR